MFLFTHFHSILIKKFIHIITLNLSVEFSEISHRFHISVQESSQAIFSLKTFLYVSLVVWPGMLFQNSNGY